MDTFRMDEPRKRRALGYYYLFNQGEYWLPRDGMLIKIRGEMDLRHRTNAANYLVRYSFNYMMYYVWGERLEEGQNPGTEVSVLNTLPVQPTLVLELPNDLAVEYQIPPKEWMRQTVLYKAMIDGLPADALELLV